MYRHGDILIVRIQAIPEGAVLKARGDRLVLAEGETTGHAHVLIGPALELWELGNRLFVAAERGGILTHEEHGVIRLEPGPNEIVRQRVYSPEAIRYVQD